MNNDFILNDIADDLLILPKQTIDRLFRLNNCIECIALYIFYYKTAKWQKTNVIKATDNYAIKALKIGTLKLRQAKETLKRSGLIEIIQRRKDGKIGGWYIKINYIFSEKQVSEIKIKAETETDSSQTATESGLNKVTQNQQTETGSSQTATESGLSKNARNQQVEKSTSRKQQTNALNNNNKCLNNNNLNNIEQNQKNFAQEIKSNKEIENQNKKSSPETEKDYKKEFDYLWSLYPRKKGKAAAYTAYKSARKGGEHYNSVLNGLVSYNTEIKLKDIQQVYIKHGSTWFKNKCWDDEYETQRVKKTSYSISEHDNIVNDNSYLENQIARQKKAQTGDGLKDILKDYENAAKARKVIINEVREYD